MNFIIGLIIFLFAAIVSLGLCWIFFNTKMGAMVLLPVVIFGLISFIKDISKLGLTIRDSVSEIIKNTKSK